MISLWKQGVLKILSNEGASGTSTVKFNFSGEFRPNAGVSICFIAPPRLSNERKLGC
jgi:hypothetical protein